MLTSRAFALVLVTGLLACPSANAATLCTMVVDAKTAAIIVKTGSCERRVTPASTFKIAISLMGFDAEFLKNEHDPALPFKPGYPDWLPAWRTTTDPTSWIRNSVVWYSQQVAQALGPARFQAYADAFQYGNHDLSGDPGKNNGLTRAWLSSSLQISASEQVEFLRALVARKLPVSVRAFDMTEHVTLVGTLPGGWTVNGKTGTGYPRTGTGELDEEHALGWFVGWAQRSGDTVVFARLDQDEKRETVTPGLRARDAFMAELTSLLAKR